MKILISFLFISAVFFHGNVLASNSIDNSAKRLFKAGINALQLKKYKEAKKYFDIGCQLKSSGSCYQLGLMYQHGLSVKANLHTAMYYLRKSCDLGEELACDTFNFLNDHK